MAASSSLRIEQKVNIKCSNGSWCVTRSVMLWTQRVSGDCVTADNDFDDSAATAVQTVVPAAEPLKDVRC